MSEPTCSQLVASRDAASLIFNLPGYRVIDAADLPLGGRRVRVETEDRDDGCPDCGVISTRVHAWSEQRVKDIPTGGEFVEVVVRKPRLVSVETECSRRTFTQRTEQLPARARCLTRLRQTLLDAVIASGRCMQEVATAHEVSWWTVQTAVDAATLTLPDVDAMAVTELGIDEHRFARVRFFRDPDSEAWRRVEPWIVKYRV